MAWRGTDIQRSAVDMTHPIAKLGDMHLTSSNTAKLCRRLFVIGFSDLQPCEPAAVERDIFKSFNVLGEDLASAFLGDTNLVPSGTNGFSCFPIL